MADRLKVHAITLRDGPLVLRPMTEDDWPILLPWNQDPEVLHFSEGEDVQAWSPEEMQGMYRDVSEQAFTFIAELDGRPVGECWLQRMNLPRVFSRHPEDLDLRRIDVMIGEKALWGRGWGTRIIGLLTRFGFDVCGADGIFGCGVADYNPRSRRAFEKNGYVVDQVVSEGPGRKTKECYDLVRWREGRPGENGRPKTRAVLLDVGGVLLDEAEHEQVRAEVTAELLGNLVPGYSVGDYFAAIDEAVRAFAPAAYKYVFWKHLRPDRERFDALYARATALYRERMPPFKLMDGIAGEVRALSADFRLGIAGQYRSDILDTLDASGIRDCFASLLTQEHFAITKPDPRYLEQIARAMDADPAACIMVGDRIDKDVIPARQLGMKTVRIRVGLHRNQQPRTPDEIPDAELDGVIGLAEAVRQVAGSA